MSNVPITGLPAVTSANRADLLPAVQSGTTSKETIAQVLQAGMPNDFGIPSGVQPYDLSVTPSQAVPSPLPLTNWISNSSASGNILTLPDMTAMTETMKPGQSSLFYNSSMNLVTLKDHGGTVLGTVPAGFTFTLILDAISGPGGTWLHNVINPAVLFNNGDPNVGSIYGHAGELLINTADNSLWFNTFEGVSNWEPSGAPNSLQVLNNLDDVADANTSANNLNLAYAFSSQNSNFSADNTMRSIRVDTSGGVITAQLDFAGSNPGRWYRIIKPSAAHNLTISAQSSEFINDLSATPNQNYTVSGKGFVELTSDGFNTWYLQFTAIIP